MREKSLKPARRRELAQFGRASWYRQSQAKDQSALRLRIRDLAHARPRFGYLRIWVLLRREGWLINRKCVRRLYRLDELQLHMLGASIFIDGKWIVPLVNPSLSKYTFYLIDSNNENRFVLRQLYRRNRASLVDKPILLDANMTC